MMTSEYISVVLFFFFFFNDTATTEIYTLSLHDALPICLVPDAAPSVAAHDSRGARAPRRRPRSPPADTARPERAGTRDDCAPGDRKSTRLNSSHSQISYAVFCLKKKKKTQDRTVLVSTR